MFVLQVIVIHVTIVLQSFFQILVERVLRPYLFALRVGRLPAVAQVFVHEARLAPVGQLDVEHVRQFLLEAFVEYGYYGLDAAVEVAPHPVGRTQKEARLASVAEVPHAGMLQEGVHDAGDADVAAVGLVGDEAADAPDDEVDFHSRFRSLVEPADHDRVLQGVHFQDDAAALAGFGQRCFVVYQFVQFGLKRATSRRWNTGAATLPFSVRKRVCRSLTMTGLQVNRPQSA